MAKSVRDGVASKARRGVGICAAGIAPIVLNKNLSPSPPGLIVLAARSREGTRTGCSVSRGSGVAPASEARNLAPGRRRGSARRPLGVSCREPADAVLRFGEAREAKRGPAPLNVTTERRKAPAFSQGDAAH